MNERQANNQKRFSKGETAGVDSSVEIKGNNKEQEGSEDAEEKQKTISKGGFLLTIFFGLILDLIGLIPLLGWGLASVLLLTSYKIIGVEFHLKNIMKFGACDLVKAVPILSVIPAFTLSVLLNVGPMLEGVEDLVGSIPGGENVANTVQKAMSLTKK